MKVVLISRATLYKVPGGDTVQIIQTAKQLKELGVEVDIRLTGEHISYKDYDLLHFFNITRPADILRHSKACNKPYMVSTILCDYSEYDKYHRGGIVKLFNYLSIDSIEYLKTIARWLLRRDRLSSLQYIWMGQRKSIIQILSGAQLTLPNSTSEYTRLVQRYGIVTKHAVISNGIDHTLFKDDYTQKDNNLVLCVARIEGIKNHLNLIKALNNTPFRLLIIGAYAPNQYNYYKQCRDIAASNVEFIDHLPQQELLKYYAQAKVHVLPSWFETTGLSTLEAAAMGCNVVITDKGDTRSYFKDHAFYCDPASPASIYQAIKTASITPYDNTFRQIIIDNYTWQQAALQTLNAYKTVLSLQPQVAFELI